MPPAVPAPDDIRPPRVPGWAIVLWLALMGYVLNLWVTYGLGWTGLLAYEVPSRAALNQGRFWTMLTYVFVNGGANDISDWVIGPLSILLLFIVGRLIEASLPRSKFLCLCAVCALAGAALWLPLHWDSGEQLTTGSTALVLGLLAYWCFTTPADAEPVHLIFVGVTRPEVFFWIALAMVTGTFIVFELPEVLGIPGAFSGGMESSAHFGAMFAGWVLARVWRRAPHPLSFPLADEPAMLRPPPQPVAVSALRSGQHAVEHEGSHPEPATPREWREEVDRILDKINRAGLDSLTVQERKILLDAKNLRKK